MMHKLKQDSQVASTGARTHTARTGMRPSFARSSVMQPHVSSQAEVAKHAVSQVCLQRHVYLELNLG